MKPKVFLTGASGSLGLSIINELIIRGYEVCALSRRNISINECNIIKGSLERLPQDFLITNSFEHIIHLASPRSQTLRGALNIDVQGMAGLLSYWKRGAFVYASSQTVYGIPVSDTLDEKKKLSSICWYDWAKITNEHMLETSANDKKNKHGVSFRLALLAGSKSRNGGNQFLDYIYSGLKNEQRFVFDDVEKLNTCGSSFIGTNTAAKVFVRILETKKSNKYNLCSCFITWEKLIKTMGRKAGVTPKIEVVAPGSKVTGDIRLPQSRSYLDPSLIRASCDVEWDDIDALVSDYFTMRQ